MAKDTLDKKVTGCNITVRAGMDGENSDTFVYVTSPIPPWAKTVDDPHYQALTSAAMKTAEDIAKYHKKTIVLKLSYGLAKPKMDDGSYGLSVKVNLKSAAKHETSGALAIGRKYPHK